MSACHFPLFFVFCYRYHHYHSGICDVTTLKDIEKLYNDQGGKLFSLKGNVLGDSSAQNKRRRIEAGGGGAAAPGSRGAVPVGVGAAFRQTHLAAAEKGKASKMFAGKEFAIYGVGTEHFCGSVDTLASTLHTHGATVVQNPTAEKTFAIIAEYSNVEGKRCTIKTGIAIKSKKYNVLRPGWLSACFDAGKEVHIKPHHVLSAKPNVQALLDNYCDAFGDCFTEDSTAAGLLELFNSYRAPVEGTRATAAEQELALFGQLRGARPMSLFREFVFYFDRYPSVQTERRDGGGAAAYASPARDGGGEAGGGGGGGIGFSARAAAAASTALTGTDGGGGGSGGTAGCQPKGNVLDRYFVEVQARGAGVRDVLTADVTHVVGDPDDRERFPHLQAIREQKVRHEQSIPEMISYDWIRNCINAKELLPIRNCVRLNLRLNLEGGGAAANGPHCKKLKA